VSGAIQRGLVVGELQGEMEDSELDAFDIMERGRKKEGRGMKGGENVHALHGEH